VQLRGVGDRLDTSEVSDVYLPLSRLINLYAGGARALHRSTSEFLHGRNPSTPFVIGVAGSVAVGKSTTARLLRELLARWDDTPRVELVTTDGFLYPNAVLEARGLMERKGFPESYDGAGLIRFLADVKAGESGVTAPVYSHLVYDVVPGERIVVDRPDILIVEGLNVLLPNRLSREGKEIPFVSDFFDFSVFLDASEDLLEKWYIERFMRLRGTSFRDPRSFFRKYADLDDEAAMEMARGIWRRINLVNLRENILPTRPRASLRMVKGASHRIERVSLRKL
jgi:type I pantothenate kinase